MISVMIITITGTITFMITLWSQIPSFAGNISDKRQVIVVD